MRTSLVLLLQFLLPLGASSLPAQQPAGGGDNAAFQRALQALNTGDAAGAQSLLEPLHRRHPASFEIDEALGLLYAGTDRLPAALPLLQAAARLQPSSAVAHANLGTALLKLGRNDAAVLELQRAALLQPSDAQTQNALGQASMLVRQPCKAAAAFAAAEGGSAPPDSDLAYNHALALFDCGRPAEARQELARMPDADSSAQAQSLLGDIAEAQKQTKEAAEHYLKAAQLAPTEANIYVFGVDLLRHWSFDPAIETFQKGLQLFPTSVRLQTGLGIAYYGAAQYSNAIHTFAALLDKDPENALDGEIFGRSCTVLTDSHDPACDRLAAMAQAHPANAALALYAAVAILHQPADAEKTRLAQELLTSAIAHHPQLPEAHYQLGVLLQGQNQWAASIPELQTALRQDPAYARAHYRLGLAYAHTGHKDEAQAEMALDRQEDQRKQDDLNARMRQITTILVNLP